MPAASRPRAEDSVLVYEEDVKELSDTILRAARARKSVPKDQVRQAVDRIHAYATVRGLGTDTLEAFVDALTVTPTYLDTAMAERVVKLLIPRKKVPNNVIVKIVGCLGLVEKKKPPLAIQHVKPFRIEALLELKRKVGSEQPVNALLQLFKNYYPDVIVVDAGPVKANIMSHPDPEWMQQVLAIQESAAVASSDGDGKYSFTVVRKAQGRNSKRRRVDTAAVPEVHTFGAHEASITLEEVRNVEDFVEKVDKLELPNQIAAVLEDPLLQTLLVLRPSDVSTTRLDHWLAACLDDQLRLADSKVTGVSDRTGVLLHKVLRHAQSSRMLLPAVANFLRIYLEKWDRKHVDPVLGLLCFLPLVGFRQLYLDYLIYLERPLISDSEASAVKLLEFYTELLRNWAIAAAKVANLERANEAQPPPVSLAYHVGDLCVNLLVTFSGTSVVADAILSFYECASSFPWQSSLFQIVLPPDPLVYHFVFFGDPMMLSRICGILSSYKSAFEESFKVGSVEDDRNRAYVDHFNGFLMDVCNLLWRNRAFVTDKPNSTTVENQNALRCNLDENVIMVLKARADEQPNGYPLQSMFSFAISPILGDFAARCFRELETAEGSRITTRHNGPVTRRTLGMLGKYGGLSMDFMTYRVKVLHYLREKGLVGVYDFMHKTMMSLINAPAASQA